MQNKLKTINYDSVLRTSDSGEESEKGKRFLKGGGLAALWNAV